MDTAIETLLKIAKIEYLELGKRNNLITVLQMLMI